MSEYFSEPKSFAGRVKVELDLSNYSKKADLRNATVVSSKFAKKSNVDKSYFNKLKNVPTNLSSLKRKVSTCSCWLK